jgi:hypothetical protein
MRRTIVGGLASLLLIISTLFLPWFSVDAVPQRQADDWLCGVGQTSCTGFDTFPIARWFILAAALAPPILAWVLIRGHQLTWPPGEMTMVVGFTAFVLVLYNGIIDIPAPPSGQEFDQGLDYGYFIALISTLVIGGTGFFRSAEEKGPVQRKAPGTV